MPLLRHCFLAAAAVLLAGCGGPHRFKGHWTVAPAISYFEPLEGGRGYYVLAGDMPKAAEAFRSQQPWQHSPALGDCQSVYLEAEGKLVPMRMFEQHFQRLHVKRIIDLGPARADYLAELAHAGRAKEPSKSKPPATR